MACAPAYMGRDWNLHSARANLLFQRFLHTRWNVQTNPSIRIPSKTKLHHWNQTRLHESVTITLASMIRLNDTTIADCSVLGKIPSHAEKWRRRENKVEIEIKVLSDNLLSLLPCVYTKLTTGMLLTVLWAIFKHLILEQLDHVPERLLQVLVRINAVVLATTKHSRQASIAPARVRIEDAVRVEELIHAQRRYRRELAWRMGHELQRSQRIFVTLVSVAPVLCVAAAP